MRTIFSGYLDKIKRFRIENPLLIQCIYLDENLKNIDWNRIRNQDDLINELKRIVSNFSINEEWSKVLLSPEIRRNFHQSIPFIYNFFAE